MALTSPVPSLVPWSKKVRKGHSNSGWSFVGSNTGGPLLWAQARGVPRSSTNGLALDFSDRGPMFAQCPPMSLSFLYRALSSMAHSPRLRPDGYSPGPIEPRSRPGNVENGRLGTRLGQLVLGEANHRIVGRIRYP